MLCHLIAHTVRPFLQVQMAGQPEASITIHALHGSISGCRQPVTASHTAHSDAQSRHQVRVREHEQWFVL